MTSHTSEPSVGKRLEILTTFDVGNDMRPHYLAIHREARQRSRYETRRPYTFAASGVEKTLRSTWNRAVVWVVNCERKLIGGSVVASVPELSSYAFLVVGAVLMLARKRLR